MSSIYNLNKLRLTVWLKVLSQSIVLTILQIWCVDSSFIGCPKIKAVSLTRHNNCACKNEMKSIISIKLIKTNKKMEKKQQQINLKYQSISKTG